MIDLSEDDKELGAFFMTIGVLIEVYGTAECARLFAGLGRIGEDGLVKVMEIIDAEHP